MIVNQKKTPPDLHQTEFGGDGGIRIPQGSEILCCRIPSYPQKPHKIRL